MKGESGKDGDEGREGEIGPAGEPGPPGANGPVGPPGKPVKICKNNYTEISKQTTFRDSRVQLGFKVHLDSLEKKEIEV